MTENNVRPPTYGESLLALLGMAVIVAVGYLGFGIRIEMLMIFSAIFAGFLAKRVGLGWNQLESAICHKLVQATPALLIIWIIGMVIGAFIFSGTIPMVIYYGLKLIHPTYFYACAFLVCLILSTATGTSWGSAGTAGVAMMGIAAGLGIPLSITAAAVICGAVFGDKMSPLSETTNLAPLCAGTTLYTHIRSMLWTTLPAGLISLLIFFLAGRGITLRQTGLPESALTMLDALTKIYHWHWVLLLPFVVIFICACCKLPPVPAMIGASLVALLIGCFYQGFDFAQGVVAAVNGFTVSQVYNGETIPEIMTLLNRGGMKSMAGVVLIVYCGYAYASIVSKAGFLQTAMAPLIQRAHSRFSLIGAALVTNFLIAACSGSSYAAFIMTGEMYQKSFIKMGLGLPVLSRTMEDSGTVMLPLVPWSAAGAFYAATLGVGVSGYGLWAVNTYLNPVMALLLALLGWGMFRLKPEEQVQELERLEQEEASL